jgi:hypothetical protein
VRKGGLPPLLPDLIGWGTAGVNRLPHLFCSLSRLFSYLSLLIDFLSIQALDLVMASMEVVQRAEY